MRSIPVDPQDAHRKKTGKEAARKSREDLIYERGGEPLFPDVEGLDYVLEYWHSVGMVQSVGMGAHRLTSVELSTWAAANCVDLLPWEFNTLRAMSAAYLEQAHASEDLACPPPYGEENARPPAEQVSKKLDDFFEKRARA